MANRFKICDLCKVTKVKSLKERILKVDQEAIIEVGCISYCGHCAKRAVLLVNNRHVMAPSEEELLPKAERHLRKKVAR